MPLRRPHSWGTTLYLIWCFYNISRINIITNTFRRTFKDTVICWFPLRRQLTNSGKELISSTKRPCFEMNFYPCEGEDELLNSELSGTGARTEFLSLPRCPFHLRDGQKRPDNPRGLPKVTLHPWQSNSTNSKDPDLWIQKGHYTRAQSCGWRVPIYKSFYFLCPLETLIFLAL